jgi:hypothetical protein
VEPEPEPELQAEMEMELGLKSGLGPGPQAVPSPQLSPISAQKGEVAAAQRRRLYSPEPEREVAGLVLDLQLEPEPEPQTQPVPEGEPPRRGEGGIAAIDGRRCKLLRSALERLTALAAQTTEGVFRVPGDAMAVADLSSARAGTAPRQVQQLGRTMTTRQRSPTQTSCFCSTCRRRLHAPRLLASVI